MSIIGTPARGYPVAPSISTLPEPPPQQKEDTEKVRCWLTSASTKRAAVIAYGIRCSIILEGQSTVFGRKQWRRYFT